MPKIPSLEELRGNIDYAARQTLKSYDDGRFWWPITSPTLGIEDLVWEVIDKDLSLKSAIALFNELNRSLAGEKPTRSPLHSLFPDSMLPVYSF